MDVRSRSALQAACVGALCVALSTTCTAADEPDAAVGRAAPDYSSAYRIGTVDIPSAAGNTPEDDARPGEYYFRLGANAFVRKDYAHAIAMYEVASSWAYKPAQYNLGVMLTQGLGAPIDVAEGMKLIALAAEKGVTPKQSSAA